MTDAELSEAFAAFAGRPPQSLARVTGSGNNRVFRVDAGGSRYALKQYALDGGEAGQRLDREYDGLRFLWAAGERRIPQALGRDAARGLAIYEWVEGTRVGAPAPADVDALASFAGSLFERRTAAGAATLREAREAVFSGAELETQIARRIVHLEALGEPVLGPLLGDIRREVSRRSTADATPLARGNRTLSPSDFGFHNALRTSAGIIYLDFEYFGWDDPVKLVADVLWHPGMALGAELRQSFFGRAAEIYGVDVSFRMRFERAAPLYGLRWALIVLNEFLPTGWSRRVAAGEQRDREAVRADQLAKAERLVGRVRLAGSPL